MVTYFGDYASIGDSDTDDTQEKTQLDGRHVGMLSSFSSRQQ